ncbi:BadF/BadG/BcrA/BcrD ATPase family protein [Albidovulum sediminis]|uniref:ATPase n=1 Tax=Albidovulum sediminis TaxID=3066345 RepID=A0ABT2NIS9_9RHOB|nr:BadF/BadG/BcrA/BcrD ATPase family protein [Defluviimonas sediminis]MCT8328826.1 ATPase [Defluviimonas sediminis]
MTQSPDLIIGIDGGGTSCRAALLFAGRRVEMRGGPANAMRFDEAMGTIAGLLSGLATQAGLPPGALAAARAHVGLAGVMTPDMAARVAAALPMRDVTVTDDQPTTIAGALGAQTGAVAAIGTGSFVGRQSDTGIRVLGGWGLPIGDQASGARLGRRLLEEVMLAIDGLRPHSGLTRAVLADHGGTGAGIVFFSATATAADFATLAPRVVAAAEAGDAVAAALMAEGAGYIAACLTALGHAAGESLCLMGGVGPAYARWLPPGMASGLRAPQGSALDGALILARAEGCP